MSTGAASFFHLRRRSRPQAIRQVEQVEGAGVLDDDEHHLRRLRERGQTSRRHCEPDEIADQEARDERQCALRAARQRTGDDRRDAGTRGCDCEQVDRGKDQQAVGDTEAPANRGGVAGA